MWLQETSKTWRIWNLKTKLTNLKKKFYSPRQLSSKKFITGTFQRGLWRYPTIPSNTQSTLSFEDLVDFDNFFDIKKDAIFVI